MSVVPIKAGKHRHIPTPWAVGYCVLCFFILKGGQIKLYPEASSYPPWSATLLRNSYLVWMLQTLFTLSIQTVSSQRRWASWRFPRIPWALCHLHLLWLQPPIVSECSIGQLCGPYYHFILAPHWRLLPSPTSILWHCRPQLESWSALPFSMVTLALWPLFSSLPQPQWWHSSPPAWFVSKLLSVWVSQPIEWTS